jgi:HlyD family secretion protein
MLEQITVDLPVVLTSEALPDRQFTGRISKIAVMPDSQSRWLNPDLRVYNAEVLVEDDSGAFRPGMSCEAEVIIERFSDALYVPVESVLLVKGKPTVYMQTPGGPRRQEVEVGLHNNKMCRIKSGLQEGDPVMLYPPLPPAAREQSQLIQLSESGGAELEPSGLDKANAAAKAN